MKKGRQTYTCPECGRSFGTRRGLMIHLGKAPHEVVKYPDEWLKHRVKGNYVELDVRMKRTLWIDLVRRAMEEDMPVDEFFFKGLVDLAAFGTLNVEEISLSKTGRRGTTYII